MLVITVTSFENCLKTKKFNGTFKSLEELFYNVIDHNHHPQILDEEEDLNKNVTEEEDTGKFKPDSLKPE